MKKDYNGDLYDVYYRDGNGEPNVFVILDIQRETQSVYLILKSVLEKT